MFKKTIKEGEVKYLPKCDDHYNRPGDKKWINANLKLSDGGILEVSEKGKVLSKLEKIILAPQVNAAPSVSANYPNIFVVNTLDQESQYTGGPLFAVPSDKEAQEWMHAINLERVRHAHQSKHPHPLTYYIPHYVIKYAAADAESLTSQVVCKDDSFNCDNCKLKYEYGGAICEFCNYKICSKCEDGFKNVLAIPFVKSPNHEHNLLQFAKAEGVEWFESGYDGNFRCDKCQSPSTGVVYHCAECNYDECEKCAAEYLKAEISNTNDNGEMKLNYELFKGGLKVFHDNEFVATNTSKLSMACSIITDRSWDLTNIETEPVPHAYCEFTFTTFEQGQKVGVGIGNKIHVGNQMLGYQQNSYGYFNTGAIGHGAYETKNYMPKFEAGDTIGVGILYDSFKQRRLYFTKNGKMLEYFPSLVHKGMDVFPGVSFSKKSGVEFTVNFKGPFKFDPNSIPNHRAECEDHLSKIPNELVAWCLSYAATSVEGILDKRLVCKIFAEQALHNAVWQPLFMVRWPLQNKKLKLKSWFTLYKRRFAVDKNTTASSLYDEDDTDAKNRNKLINNCDFEFLCPLQWSALAKGDDNPDERHCDKCNKTVYRVDDEATLRSYAEKGRCVTMFKKRDLGEDLLRPRMMGMPPPRPRKISNPFAGLLSGGTDTASEDSSAKKKGFFSKLFGK